MRSIDSAEKANAAGGGASSGAGGAGGATGGSGIAPEADDSSIDVSIDEIKARNRRATAKWQDSRVGSKVLRVEGELVKFERMQSENGSGKMGRRTGPAAGAGAAGNGDNIGSSASVDSASGKCSVGSGKMSES